MPRRKKFISWEEAVLWLKGRPERADLVRACYYDDPLIEAAERFRLGPEWSATLEYLPDDPCPALDIGAGRGVSSYALARQGFAVTALEPDKSRVVGAGAITDLAREGGLEIEVVVEWGEKLPFPDQSFGLVYMRQALHHARDLEALCREVGRVLRPGGRFIAAREHVISKQSDLELFLRSHPLQELYGGENAFMLKQYLGALDKGGIEPVRVLNPYMSDINLFPESVASVKKRLAAKLRLPFPGLIPDRVLAWLGGRSNAPGRLYTFIGTRRNNG